jgi:ABC-type uncharacterized transport system substrate-binding protein
VVGAVASCERASGELREETIIEPRAVGLIVICALGILIAPRAAEAQQSEKVWRIGYLAGSPRVPQIDAFVQGLRELGYVEGHNLVLDIKLAHGRLERLPDLAAELVQAKPDVIVAAANVGGLAAKQATSTIPIVVVASHDGVHVRLVEVRSAAEFDAAFMAILGDRPDGVLVVTDPLVFAHRERIAQFTVQHKLPAIYEFKAFAELGGLMSYGPNMPALWRRAAYYADRILKGTKPADFPAEQPMKFELVINLKTAQALGLTVPPSLLFQADEVIR